MARQFIFLFLLCLAQAAFGQKTKNHLARIPPTAPTKKETEAEERNHRCVKKTNRSFSTRLKNHPFDRSAQIQFVSFASNGTAMNETVSVADSLPRLNDTICYSQLREVKTLTFSQVDKLTDILYNYGFAGPVHTMDMALCYRPRNAILFLDSTGKAFAFVEICFECDRLVKSSDKVLVGDWCDQKMDMLKELFIEVGVKYGVTQGTTAPD